MPRPEHVACVLFDFDGVIVDSEPIGARRNQRILNKLGVPATYDDCIAMSGLAAKTEVPKLLERYGSNLTYDDFEALSESPEFPMVYFDPDMAVYPGVRELLASLRSRGVPVGLVTTTAAPRIVAALDRFRLMSAFDVMVTRELVTHYKPNPEPYQHAMELLRTRPEETVVLEDSPVGIAAAKAAGAYVYGVCVSSCVQDTSQADELVRAYEGFDPVASA